ncbi:3-isopropylmalate dehydratase small subunit [Streptomyces sp. LZ34]
MKPFTTHEGRCVALRRDHVDTDQIVPAEFCKRLTKSGYDDALFAAWRTDPGFVLNRPEAAHASILLAGSNFGTGSSREHAVWALRDWGFVAVIASSFGDIFRRSAFKNGLLAVELPAEAVAELSDAVDTAPATTVVVDLVACEVRHGPRRCGFAVDERSRRLLLDGLDEIAVTLRREPEIAAYESRRRYWLPGLKEVEK